MNKPLFTGCEWDNKLLLEMWDVINDIAINKFGLSYYPNPTLEIVSYDQMIYYCNNHGLPLLYDHWSFGKNYIATKQAYHRGQHGLAYEVIINSNPLRAYLMDTNTATIQALVLAHAICGHGHFFTNNHLFKRWTIADYILDYVKFAHDYVKQAEVEHGYEDVEAILDDCHALQYFGVDKYKRSSKMKEADLQARYDLYKEDIERNQSELWTSQKYKSYKQFCKGLQRTFPEENMLYFIEKHSKILKPWQRELVRIVRKIAQYFYPQYQTKLMNEGFASFVHYELMSELHAQGYLTEGSYLEFLHNHTAVCCARDGAATNPYSLGYAIFKEVFEKNGKSWDVVKDIVINYRDESFIRQFLSKDVVKKFKLATLEDNAANDFMQISEVHDDEDFEKLKETLAYSWSHENYMPTIEIVEENDTRVLLRHYRTHGVKIEHYSAAKTLEAFERLYGKSVILNTKSVD